MTRKKSSDAALDAAMRGGGGTMEIGVFVPDPKRPRIPFRIQFDDGVIELLEPPDDADPCQILDLGGVLCWLNLMQANPGEITILALRHAVDAYRRKWEIPEIMLPKTVQPPVPEKPKNRMIILPN